MSRRVDAGQEQAVGGQAVRGGAGEQAQGGTGDPEEQLHQAGTGTASTPANRSSSQAYGPVPGPFVPAASVKYSTPMNSAPKLPASVNSHEVGGIWVAWARRAAVFRSAYSWASIRAAICSSGVPNGRSSTFSTAPNGLFEDSAKVAIPAESTLRGTAVQ